MRPIGRLPVTFQLGTIKHKDELHIYPEVTGVLLSRKAAKRLNILPECYPHPINTTLATPKKCLLASKVHTLEAPSHPTPTSADLVKEFVIVFNGVIKLMEGEEFHISLVDDDKPFCVNTPRSIAFAYPEKLRAELDLLQTQGIIAPVTEPTKWCAPIVVTP